LSKESSIQLSDKSSVETARQQPHEACFDFYTRLVDLLVPTGVPKSAEMLALLVPKLLPDVREKLAVYGKDARHLSDVLNILKIIDKEMFSSTTTASVNVVKTKKKQKAKYKAQEEPPSKKGKSDDKEKPPSSRGGISLRGRGRGRGRGSFQSHRGYWRGSHSGGRSRGYRGYRGYRGRGRGGRGRGRGKNYHDRYDDDSYDYQEQEQEQEREQEQEQEQERYTRKVLVTKKKEGKKAEDAALLDKVDAASKEG